MERKRQEGTEAGHFAAAPFCTNDLQRHPYVWLAYLAPNPENDNRLLQAGLKLSVTPIRVTVMVKHFPTVLTFNSHHHHGGLLLENISQAHAIGLG